MPNIQLRGITRDHSRGDPPKVATARRFLEAAGFQAVWQKRSLQAFADVPLQRPVDRYDQLIVDRPFDPAPLPLANLCRLLWLGSDAIERGEGGGGA